MNAANAFAVTNPVFFSQLNWWIHAEPTAMLQGKKMKATLIRFICDSFTFLREKNIRTQADMLIRRPPTLQSRGRLNGGRKRLKWKLRRFDSNKITNYGYYLDSWSHESWIRKYCKFVFTRKCSPANFSRSIQLCEMSHSLAVLCSVGISHLSLRCIHVRTARTHSLRRQSCIWNGCECGCGWKSSLLLLLFWLLVSSTEYTPLNCHRRDALFFCLLKW